MGVACRMVLGALLIFLVTSGSMMIIHKDYHDHRHGVDTAPTEPHRPLVTGDVPARQVVKIPRISQI